MGQDRSLDRRRFLSAALVGLAPKSEPKITGGFLDDGHAAGHRLRDHAALPAIKRQQKVPLVIVGGGMAGLCAGWRLLKRGFHDFVILELAQSAGGNSRWGQNEVSAYPWGAHYVPVPNTESVLVRELLEDLGAFRNGQWEERYLCFSPQERLFIHGRWQEGIEPEIGLAARDRAQFRRFQTLTAEARATRQFTIPLELGAKDSDLDRETMSAWLGRNGFDSPYLRWYVDYACRDDYGGTADSVSAWAGIHYFAAREHSEKGPLTWPEGNGWIARRLTGQLGTKVQTNSPVSRITQSGTGWQVSAGDTEWRTDAVIFAAPTFLASYIVENAVPTAVSYSPWITANLTLSSLPEESGFPLAWDNVFYKSNSLGYVDATHQSLRTWSDRTVWTWYKALAQGSPVEVRRSLLARSWESWREDILADLEIAHPEIRSCVSDIQIARFGHAMARPEPGSLARVLAQSRSLGKAKQNMWFANSDQSGLSIFEQAQANGVKAADAALARIGSKR